jgi:hypothetical protein
MKLLARVVVALFFLVAIVALTCGYVAIWHQRGAATALAFIPGMPIMVVVMVWAFYTAFGPDDPKL